MVTISLCMIVKNEEKVLARCLNSVKDGVDEIIIVDTGSNDSTVEIAKSFTDKVFSFEWINDFSAARNYAFSKAVMDYQFWLDADDVIEETELLKLISLKNGMNSSIDMVTMAYDTHFDKDGNVLLSSTRERLLKRENNYKWVDKVHECIPLQGNIFYSDIRISHRKENVEGLSYRNIEIYEEMEKENLPFSPRQTYYYARELFDHGMFEKCAELLRLFLDGEMGWKEDNISACVLLGKCCKALGKNDEALKSFLKSFEYDGPRPEACCQLGYYFKELEDYATAIKWFETALNTQNDAIGFVSKEYSGYIPNIELCVCYYKIGDTGKSIFHNEAAEMFKKNDETVIRNRAFFANLFATAETAK